MKLTLETKIATTPRRYDAPVLVPQGNALAAAPPPDTPRPEDVTRSGS